MPARTQIDETAQQLFVQVWRHCKKEYCVEPCGGDCSTCRPTPDVVLQLLKLVASERSKSIRELEPAIALMLQERQYTTASGDSMVGGRLHPPIEKQTELVIQTLERMKLIGEAKRQGAGTSEPPREMPK